MTWKDSTWSGVTWKSSDFTTGEWENHSYDDDGFLTSFWGPQPPAGQVVPGELFTPRRAADRKP